MNPRTSHRPHGGEMDGWMVLLGNQWIDLRILNEAKEITSSISWRRHGWIDGLLCNQCIDLSNTVGERYVNMINFKIH